MREKIEELIKELKLRKQEVFEESNELSQINKQKLCEDEKRILEDRLLLLEQEYSLRNSFICELHDLL